jgi:hypothetical protein
VRKQNGRNDKKPVTLEEFLVSSFAQSDVLAKRLIEKGLITREEFMQKISEERATYQKLSNLTHNNRRVTHRSRQTSCINHAAVHHH